MNDTPSDVAQALCTVRRRLDDTSFPLQVAGAGPARKARKAASEQIGDYLLPRLANLEAPLLVVVGGSTGSGKSTLVNSLVGQVVTEAGAIRPTTRQPLLLATEEEMDWFRSERILPGLRRVDRAQADPTEALTLRASPAIPPHMAVLDAPDIDSVADENRTLARKLLDAADLWVFVTTANRYADAAAWALLEEAAARSVTVGVVLNRVPPGAQGAVTEDLRRLLDSRGMASSPIFTVEETSLVDGQLIPASLVEPIRHWLESIANDRARRLEIVRQSLDGTIRQLADTTDGIAAARGLQEETGEALETIINQNYAAATKAVLGSATDGSLLRGEVLSRWQDFVGTSDVFRSLESWIGSVRDRISGWFTGTPAPIREIETEIATGLAAVLINEAAEAAANTWNQLRQSSAGRELFTDPALRSESPGAEAAAISLVRQWQDDLLDLIRQETPGKRQQARMVSLGVNTVAIALMILVFASTGGLLGGELMIAGGSAVVGQKLLETIFGDQAVRKLTRQGEELLQGRVEEFFTEESGRYRAILVPVFAGTSAAELAASAAKLREVAP